MWGRVRTWVTLEVSDSTQGGRVSSGAWAEVGGGTRKKHITSSPCHLITSRGQQELALPAEGKVMLCLELQLGLTLDQDQSWDWGGSGQGEG